MPKLTYYEQGSYNFSCDECVRGFKSSQMRKRWDGLHVCGTCYEIRNPQDFVRAVKDDPSVPVARPRNIVYLVNSDNIASPYPLAGEYLGQYPLGGI